MVPPSASLTQGLNPPQRAAVETLRGPLLVLAGAGSGKTRVVTVRIANLIRHGTRPDRILAVTFTNKAAVEMQERISKILGGRKDEENRPQISTFHSHCVRVLRRHIRQLGYPEKFAIYDRGDQESLARQVLREIRVSNELMRPGDLLYFISRWKTMSILPQEANSAAKTDKEHLAAMGYRRYQKALKNSGAVDFDDLLVLTEILFQDFPAAKKAEASLFDHILVDEYQDTNGSQYRIIKALADVHRNLCVVGDDDQSIYGWRGAEVQHILRFAKDWPDAQTVRLEMNYRSTAAILELANRLIKFNRVRHDKTLQPARPGGERPRILQFQDENLEASEIVSDIRSKLAKPGIEPRDIAILFRTNEQPRPFEQELMAAAVKAGKPLWHAMQPGQRPPLADAANAALDRFVNLVTRFGERFAKEKDLAAVARDLITDIGYRQEVKRTYPEEQEQEQRWNTVEEFVNTLAAHQQQAKKPSLSKFVDEVTLGERDFGDSKEKELARNAIALMTMHSAKGLEFPHVYMVGLEEGVLPHHRTLKAEAGDDIEEERRLAYVGVTRAQEYLTLSLPLTRMKWGKARETQPSRFWFEMIGQAENAVAAANASKKMVANAGKNRQ